MKSIRYVECPRDAWQGLARTIPTQDKRDYLQALQAAGFRQLDAASFVSPKAVPQMADSEQVLANWHAHASEAIIGIVANMRGLERALRCDAITHVGYPLSVSDRFQQQNSGKDVEHSWQLLVEMQQALAKAGRGLVVYVSMGFGNPYGEPWHPRDSAAMVARLQQLGINDIALADTVGVADPETLAQVLSEVGEQIGDLSSIGVHLHAAPHAWQALLAPALQAGIRWIEGALAGQGGCPFADDALVGNLPTEQVVPWLEQQGYTTGIDLARLPTLSQRARTLAQAV